MKGHHFLFVVLFSSIVLGCRSSSVIDQAALLQSYEITLTDASSKNTTVTQVVEDMHPDGREAGLLSAFYGLDSALPPSVNFHIHKGSAGKDGMPVVL